VLTPGGVGKPDELAFFESGQRRKEQIMRLVEFKKKNGGGNYRGKIFGKRN